jgi:hypothetical protein
MSMVHISYGLNKPASPDLLSEIAIVSRAWPRPRWAALRMAWKAYRGLRRIRDDIEKVFDDFYDYNARVAKPGGFHLVASRERVGDRQRQGAIRAADHRAGYADPPAPSNMERLMVMMPRSHDQYNTTIYAMDDRYRGVFGMRR